MPMSYLYGRKYHGPITDLVKLLRREIHTIPYEEIDWNKARHDCCKVGGDRLGKIYGRVCTYKFLNTSYINQVRVNDDPGRSLLPSCLHTRCTLGLSSLLG